MYQKFGGWLKAKKNEEKKILLQMITFTFASLIGLVYKFNHLTHAQKKRRKQ